MTTTSMQFGQSAINVVIGEGQVPAKLATDASGNVTGMVVPSGSVFPVSTHPMSCVIYGDSMTAQNYVTSASLISYSDRGYFNWANAYLGQRFRLLANAGTAGDTTALMLARIQTDVIARAPGWCFVLAGYNDVNNGVASSTTIANLKAIYQKLVGNGIKVVALAMLPSSTFSTTTKQEAVAAINLWIREYCAQTQGMIFVDTYSALLDPTSAAGAHVTAYLTDTIHPSTSGAQRLGKAIYSALDGVLPPAGLPLAISDRASATFPYGCITTNPAMQGTGGNAQAGTSGTIAANWNAIREDASSTTVLSKVARTDLPSGFEWQQLDITQASAAQAVVDLYKSFALPSGVAVGDVVYAEAEVAVSNLATTTIGDLKVFIQATGGSGVVAAYGLGNNNGSIAADGQTLTIRTPDFTIPTGTTALVMTVQITLAAAGSVTLKVGRAEMRRVYTLP